MIGSAVGSVSGSKHISFLLCCFCLLAGIAAASIYDRPVSYTLLFTALSINVFALISLRKKDTARIYAFALCCFLLGICRYSTGFPRDGPKDISHYAQQPTVFTGYIASEPDVRINGVRYIIAAQYLDSPSDVLGISQEVGGRVLVAYNRYPRFGYGDRLRISCRLRTPEPIEDFRYDRYLARFGVFAACERAQITQIDGHGGSTILHLILSVKESVAEKINTLWHEPYASFMAGLLYGYRGGLGTLNELFARTGVTHIVAISGYNITIVSNILMAACVRLMIPRQKAFWLMVVGIAVFLIFAGLSASVVRAGIMGIIVLIARRMGRSSRVFGVMVLTAVVMSIHNPFILFYDAGFQLSFLSTLGLVYLTEPFQRYAAWIPNRLMLRESAVSTIAAILATLPLILWQFGRLSIVAPMVNLLILWLIPWIMMLGFVTVLLAFIFGPAGMVVSWIAYAGMAYIVFMVIRFAEFSFAAVDIRISTASMIALYAIGIAGVARSGQTKKTLLAS